MKEYEKDLVKCPKVGMEKITCADWDIPQYRCKDCPIPLKEME